MKNKTRNILGVFLLFIVFVIIKIFLGGVQFYHFWEELLPELIVFAIICFICMIIPTTIVIKNKKRIERNKGKKICLINSLVITILMIIPNIINIVKYQSQDNNIVMSFDPVSFSKWLILICLAFGVIYFCINYLFYVEGKK